MGSSEHPGALQYPGGSRASWGAQTLSPVRAPRSIPGPAEHPKLLGTPRTPGNTLDSWEHPSSSMCGPEEQPEPLGPSRILRATGAPERPPNPWEPLEPFGASRALWSTQGVPELAQLPPPTDSTHCWGRAPHSRFPSPQEGLEGAGRSFLNPQSFQSHCFSLK